MLVMSYYIFRCIFVIFPKFDKRTDLEQVMIVIQLVGMCLVLLGIAYSYYRISVISVLLYI